MKVTRWLLLMPFSLLYGCVVWLRNKLFDWNWIRHVRFDIRTISVGNLSTGGTGKTPHIIWLAKNLSEYSPVVLSRGYGRKSKDFKTVFSNSAVSEVGDEPLMMKYHNPELPVFVDADRVVGITHAMYHLPDTGMILLDDCFQHRYVLPEKNILLTTFDAPFFLDHLLPGGNLREWRSGAKRASLVIVTKCPETLTQSACEVLNLEIAKYTKAPVYYSTFVYPEAHHHLTQTALLPRSRVILLTGLASSNSLKNYISKKHEIISEIAYPDHHDYNVFNLRRLAKKIDQDPIGDLSIITTEKDYIKILHNKELLETAKSLPIYVQRVEVAILFDGADSLLAHLIN